MAKQIGRCIMCVVSDDEGTTKSVNFQYDVVESTDVTLKRSGKIDVATPDTTKTADLLYTEGIAAIKTAEGIS